MRWLGLNEEERQTLTTWAMLGGVAALTVAVGLLVYVLRYSWPAAVLAANASTLIAGLFNVVFGLLGLMGVMIVAQAVIAIGGRMSAEFWGAKINAESDRADDPPQ